MVIQCPGMDDKLVYGFLDESPNLSDSAYFFCVDIISTSERTNKALQNIIKRARRKTVKKQIRQLSEIKFHNSDEKTRKYILTEIAKVNIRIIVLVIDKEGRAIKDTPLNYGIAIGSTVAELLSLYPVLNITMDKKFSSIKEETESLKVTQEVIEELAPKNKNIVFNPPTDSKKEPLLQLADFVAGAMNSKYNNKDNHYAEIIEKRVIKEKKVKWASLKKRIVNP